MANIDLQQNLSGHFDDEGIVTEGFVQVRTLSSRVLMHHQYVECTQLGQKVEASANRTETMTKQLDQQ